MRLVTFLHKELLLLNVINLLVSIINVHCIYYEVAAETLIRIYRFPCFNILIFPIHLLMISFWIWRKLIHIHII